ncbi:MAG: hypothetical protein Q9174_006009, partial [Haloplaca sp. 1 TL-2023]
SCTDPTFQDPACTTYCTSPGTHPFGWADVLLCPLSDDWYCGWGNQSRCESGETFKIEDGYFADFRSQDGGQVTVNVGNGNEVAGGGKHNRPNGDRGKECSPTTTVEATAPETTTITVVQPAGETGRVVTAGGILENGTTAPLGAQSSPTPEAEAFGPENGGYSVRQQGWIGIAMTVAVTMVSTV